jgi:hypothetical protein
MVEPHGCKVKWAMRHMRARKDALAEAMNRIIYRFQFAERIGRGRKCSYSHRNKTHNSANACTSSFIAIVTLTGVVVVMVRHPRCGRRAKAGAHRSSFAGAKIGLPPGPEPRP